jgi:flavoprotein
LDYIEGSGDMAKMQIDLSKEEDKIVEVYKLVHDLKTKQEAIKQMIRYFEAEIKPKKLNNKDYFQV